MITGNWIVKAETYINTPLRHKGNAPLRVWGRVLRKEFELVIVVFVVANVSISERIVSIPNAQK